MALGDYRACDVCGGKTFYDASLDYNGHIGVPPFRIAGKDQEGYQDNLIGCGDWAVLCLGCSKTHRTAILPIARAADAGGKEGM